jgi:uncharacterized protein (TIGR02996 family)
MPLAASQERVVMQPFDEDADRRARPEVLAFLHDIKTHPDDDRRLVFADWLDDHGDEHDAARGEFLRLQVELSHLSVQDRRWNELHERAGRLSALHLDTWLGPLRSVEHARSHHRGLLQLRLHARHLLGLREGALAGTEYLAWVDGLRFDSARLKEVIAIGERSLLDGVTKLSLNRCELGAEGTRAMVETSRLDLVEDLDLGSNRLTEWGLATLVRWPDPSLTPTGTGSLDCLTRLNLSDNRLGTQAMETLAGSTLLVGLTHLDLSGNDLGETALSLLLASGKLGRLRSLAMVNNRLSGMAGVRIASTPELAGLTSLDLYGNSLGDQGVVALATSPYLSNLESLSVGHNQLTGRAALALASSPYLTRLKNLDFSYHRGTDEEIEGLRRRFGDGLRA